MCADQNDQANDVKKDLTSLTELSQAGGEDIVSESFLDLSGDSSAALAEFAPEKVFAEHQPLSEVPAEDLGEPLQQEIQPVLDAPQETSQDEDSPNDDLSVLDAPHDDLSVLDAPHDDLSVLDAPHDDLSVLDAPHDDLSVLDAPPATASLVQNTLEEPPSAEKAMSDVKNFAQKIPIGKPQIEASPAFSFLGKNHSGTFDEETIKFIEMALNSEEYGIRLDELKIQLSEGKLFVPRISEFAAVSLGQKLFDKIDQIEIDLSENIFKNSLPDSDNDPSASYIDRETFAHPKQEVHDVAAEPKKESDLFSSNLHEIENHHVTRILSTLHVSEIIDAQIAESTTSPAFEATIEKLTRTLRHKAFELGAHGVIGISFSLKSIDAHRDESGRIQRAYRLFGTGTAVRVKKTS